MKLVLEKTYGESSQPNSLHAKKILQTLYKFYPNA